MSKYYEKLTYSGLDIQNIEYLVSCDETIGYNYTYDKDHRITTMREQVGDAYSMDATYDEAGNIQTLKRKGLLQYGQDGVPNTYGQMDNMIYTYTNGSSRIEKISEDADVQAGFDLGNPTAGFSYDGAGNATVMGGLNMNYNLLNLPQSITKNLNPQATNPLEERSIEIINQYSYDGDKMSSQITQQDGQNSMTTHRLTLNGFVIENDPDLGVYVPKSYAHESGRLVWEDEIPKIEHAIRDHLGNTRVIYRDDNGDGQISTQDADDTNVYDVRRRYDYYPFGLELKGRWTPAHDVTVDNRMRYNGKELSDDAGLYYYGARVYEPSIGRFTGVDPLADAPHLVGWSPYHYTYNNPINYIDPDGRSPIKGLKALFNVGRRAYKTYKKTGKINAKTIGKGLKDEVLSIVDNASTLLDGNLNADDAFAVIDLVTGFGGEAKKLLKGTKGGKRAGKDFTKKGKGEVIDANKKSNNGTTVCEDCGTGTVPAKKSEKGVSPPSNETQVDHIFPKSKGGDGSPSNGQVLCRDCNRTKSDKVPK